MLILSRIVLLVTLCGLFSILTFIYAPNARAELPMLTLTQTSLGEEFTCAHSALNEAYHELGYGLTYQTLPNKRALKSSNEGIVDGEMLRSDGVEVNYPNLIRIPIPICAVESVLLAKANVAAESFEDIKNYRMGITSGFVDQERFINTYQIDAARAVRNEILIEMFLRDRVDVIFLTRRDAKNVMSQAKNKQYKIISGLNRQVYLYHYLHKKHSNLVPLITHELHTLEQQGRIQLMQRADLPKYNK